MPAVVLHMNDRRPAWAMPDWVVPEIRAALPEGWELRVVEEPADGSGDGLAAVSPAVLEAVRDAEVYMGFGIPAEVLREGVRLRWVHTGAAGVRGSLTPELRASPVVLTNSAGIHGPPMAETVLAMILHFARGLDLAVQAKAAGVWDRAPFMASDHPLRELSSSVVGLVGYGGVGREVGWRVRALGARVLALRRRSGGGRREEEGVEVLHGGEGLQRLLATSDCVVLCAPETPRTRGIIDAGALRAMKPTAVLVNVARGRLVDEDALVEALRTGEIRGAALDVFQEEPLPADHPFWTLPNVLLTPHVSAVTRHFWRRETDLILENLRRFFAGEPLRNVVDKEEGY